MKNGKEMAMKTEQEMNRMIETFAFEFRQRYGDDFKIVIKPIRHRRWKKRRI